MEKTDTLNLLCPSCGSFIEVTTYSGKCQRETYSPDNAPLIIIAEVNDMSKKGEIQCMICGMHIAFVVSYTTITHALSDQERYDSDWIMKKSLKRGRIPL